MQMFDLHQVADALEGVDEDIGIDEVMELLSTPHHSGPPARPTRPRAAAAARCALAGSAWVSVGGAGTGEHHMLELELEMTMLRNSDRGAQIRRAASFTHPLI
jgi:hypothetical protein